MANPFYPPKGARPDRGDASRGSIGHGADEAPLPFDPDRRGLWNGEQAGIRGRRQDSSMAFEDRNHARNGTEGPGGAAAFYVQDDIYSGGPRAGAAQPGLSYQPHPHHPGAFDNARYPPVLRSEGPSLSSSPRGPNATLLPHGQYNGYANGGGSFPQRYPEALYAYEDDEEDDDDDAFRAKEAQRKRAAAAGGLGAGQSGFTASSLALDTARLNQYPPPSVHDINRPGTPGIYLDRPPRKEALNEKQREILATFPEDLDEEKGGLLTSAKKMAKNWREWVRWKYAHYYIILVFICVLVALMTIYHRQIIDWLTPVSKKINSVSWGWIIPVAILFVISFPPLFGHEIVGILCGVVYGLWIGFGILSLGTLLGEIGNFYAFKWFLKKHGERYERKSLNYACMAHIVREGGFMVVLLARLSAIPGHFTTAVFATVGMNIFVFTIAAVLSLPKQLVVVYLGVAIEQSGSGQESTQSKVIKWVVLIISFAVTIVVAIYLYDKMNKARPLVQSRLRQRRYTLLSEAAPPKEHDSTSGPYPRQGQGHAGSESLGVDDMAETKIDMYGNGDPTRRTQDAREEDDMQRTPTIKFTQQGGWRYRDQQRQQGVAPLQATQSILRKPDQRAESPPSGESVSSHNHSPTRPLNYQQHSPAVDYDPEATIRVVNGGAWDHRYSSPTHSQDQHVSPRFANPYDSVPQQQQQQQQQRQQQQRQQQQNNLKPKEPAHYQRVSGVGSVYELPPLEVGLADGSRRAQDDGETSPNRPPSYHTDTDPGHRSEDQHQQQQQQQYHQQQRNQMQQGTASTASWNGGLAL